MNSVNIYLMVVAVTIFAWGPCGCSANDAQEIKSLDADIGRIQSCLHDDSFDIDKFGYSLGQRLASVKATNNLNTVMCKLRDSILDLQIDTDKFSERKRLRESIYRVIGGVCLGIVQNGGDYEVCWNMRILRLKVMQDEIVWGESNKAKEEWNPPICQARVPFVSVMGLTGETYVHSLRSKYDLSVSDVERVFNRDAQTILSPEQVSAIRTKLEGVLGRPIRSDEDIARDRQRKIDAKIEEARRRQEERLGNDVRVDIDSL